MGSMEITERTKIMAFPTSIVDQAWNKSGGQCECTRTGHGHSGRCSRELLKVRRGVESPYGWETHHKTVGCDDTLSNCEVLCLSCHKETQTYED